MVDDHADGAIIHIEVDHLHFQKNGQMRYRMFEQMIINNYEDAQVIPRFDQHGQLTDMWIHFKDPTEATHFQLTRA